MTERPPSMFELLETDALLDSVAAREPRGAHAGDQALAALAMLAWAVDEQPLPALSEARAVKPPARHPHHNSRGVGLVLAGVLTLTSGGIAAAVTGDPLTPIKAVVHHLYGDGDTGGPDSNWVLGGGRHDGARPGSTSEVLPGSHPSGSPQGSDQGQPWDDVLGIVRDGGVPHPESKVVLVVPVAHAHHDPGDPRRGADTPRGNTDHRDTTDTRDSDNGDDTSRSPRSHRPSPSGPTTPDDTNGTGPGNDQSTDPAADQGNDGSGSTVMRQASVPGPPDPCQASADGPSSMAPSTSSVPTGCGQTGDPQPAEPAATPGS